MDFDDDILSSFIEDTREHLAGIEACLMDLEEAGADADQELVNTIFRAAHSIKGGAGFLGLSNARDLAHRLENVLHMVRGGELVPDNGVVSPLLKGFDLLRGLVENGQAGNAMDIAGALSSLEELATGHLPPAHRERLASAVEIALPGSASPVILDRLSLEKALQGGRYLYLVEYDLIHDVHARGKTPLDVISALESSGLILDCRMDLAAVGDLDSGGQDPPGSARIPFFLLYATIADPDVSSYLFVLDRSRIQVVDHEALLAGDGTGERREREDSVRLALAGELGPDALDALKAPLMDALDSRRGAILDLAGAREATSAFVQFVCAAHRSFAAKGLPLALAGTPPGLGRRLAGLGLSPKSAAGCGLSANDRAGCPWLAHQDNP